MEWLQDLQGVEAATAAECEAACDALAGCNGASFYPDPVAFFGKAGKNCWMKTFVDSCAPPAAAVAEPLAVMLLKCASSRLDSITTV
jgi:hypothetical protein